MTDSKLIRTPAELDTCPFCGGPAKMIQAIPCCVGTAKDSCRVQAWGITSDGWNRRATPSPVSHAGGSLGITKEWFERRAKAEADLEIGAGFSVINVTDEDVAKMEVVTERALPQWAQDELMRLRKRSSVLDGLLSANDMWTDYGSGYRIHFSFSVNNDASLVGKLNEIRAALAAAAEGSADA